MHLRRAEAEDHGGGERGQEVCRRLFTIVSARMLRAHDQRSGVAPQPTSLGSLGYPVTAEESRGHDGQPQR